MKYILKFWNFHVVGYRETTRIMRSKHLFISTLDWSVKSWIYVTEWSVYDNTLIKL